MNSDIFYQIKHQESHQRLIKSSPRDSEPVSASRPPKSELDAIIVPSSRPAYFLNHAIDLALATDSWFIIFCSGSSKRQDVKELLDSRFFGKAAAAEVPRAYMHPLIEFSTSSNVDFKRANLYRDNDLSIKRNLGLILSQMLGWKKIFFLDDDIRDLTAADLHRTASLLDKYSCVGFSMDYFPDNSVVSHAKRLGFDDHQEIMISGAAIGVCCRPEMSFFPDIYNEDLFFILNDIARGAVLHAGSVSQLPYEPFNRPERAASEEFGEVLMEGLLALLHTGTSLAHATNEYWLEFLPVRMKHIEYIRLALERRFRPGHEPALMAMRAAEVRLSEISSTLCAAYLTELQADLIEWKQRLRSLTPQSSVSAALSYLNLMHVPAAGERQDAAGTERYEVVFRDTTISSELPRSADRSPAYGSTAADEPGTIPVAASSSPNDLLRTGSLMHPAAEQRLIRKLSEDDWMLLRQVRLQALQDSPRAFASSYHKEEGFTELQWRVTIRHDLQWFVAFVGTEPVGVVAARSGPDISPRERYVESMWVAPGHRGAGIASELMSKLTETVHAEGAHTLFLWVLDGNDMARKVYLKLGFTYTGDRQSLETYPNRTEERMRRPITLGRS